jgi:LacI family transcriptional regulator
MSLRGEFHSEFLAAFESLASRRGLEVIISASESEEPLWKRAQRLVASRTCGGLVVRYDILSERDVGELSKVKAPLVLANFHKDLPLAEMGLHSVGFDNKEGTRSAVRHLVSLGHKRIAYLGGTPGWMDSVDREEGFRAGMLESGLQIEGCWVESCDFADGFASAFERMAQILSRKVEGPTALVCASDEIAAGAIACLRRWGKKIPADFSVTGFDDNRWSSYLSTPLTTIRHSGWALGEAVGGILLDMMKGEASVPTKEIVLELQLIVRNSTGPVPNL